MPPIDPKEASQERRLTIARIFVLLSFVAMISGIGSFIYGLIWGPEWVFLMGFCLLVVWVASFGLYYLFGYLAVSIVTNKQAKQAKAEEKSLRERKKEEEDRARETKARLNKYYWAFLNGISSDYPATDVTRGPLPLKAQEVCYAFASPAVLGRGSPHNVEISNESRWGVDKVIQFGRITNVKESFSTIRYEETRPGWLFATNQRIAFISPPLSFLEITLDRGLSVAWGDRYVMLRTDQAEQGGDVLAFRIDGGDYPSWLIAAAISRAMEDSAATARGTGRVRGDRRIG